MRIDLEELLRVQRYLRRLETVPLEEIEWFLADEKVDVAKSDTEEWKHVGLSNKDFALNYLIAG